MHSTLRKAKWEGKVEVTEIRTAAANLYLSEGKTECSTRTKKSETDKRDERERYSRMQREEENVASREEVSKCERERREKEYKVQVDGEWDVAVGAREAVTGTNTPLLPPSQIPQYSPSFVNISPLTYPIPSLPPLLHFHCSPLRQTDRPCGTVA